MASSISEITGSLHYSSSSLSSWWRRGRHHPLPGYGSSAAALLDMLQSKPRDKRHGRQDEKKKRQLSFVPDWYHPYHDEREDHLHVGQRWHAETTEDEELQDLQACEIVDLPLGHSADVMCGRIGSLGREKSHVRHAATWTCNCRMWQRLFNMRKSSIYTHRVPEHQSP